MALTYVGDLTVTLRLIRTVSADLGVAPIVDELKYRKTLAILGAYGDSNSVAAGVPVTYDLRGSLADPQGTTISRTAPCMILVRNKSTTTGQYITVGAGSNPIASCWGAAGDAAVCGPDSVLLLSSVVDGFTTTAGTADILTLTAAAGTPTFDLLIWWL